MPVLLPVCICSEPRCQCGFPLDQKNVNVYNYGTCNDACNCCHSGMYVCVCVCVCVCVQQTSTSDGGQFAIREELDNYKWFWGNMNRADSEAKMKAEGKIGNFAIRVNATGSYVMTFWLDSSTCYTR